MLNQNNELYQLYLRVLMENGGADAGLAADASYRSSDELLEKNASLDQIGVILSHTESDKVPAANQVLDASRQICSRMEETEIMHHMLDELAAYFEQDGVKLGENSTEKSYILGDIYSLMAELRMQYKHLDQAFSYGSYRLQYFLGAAERRPAAGIREDARQWDLVTEDLQINGIEAAEETLRSARPAVRSFCPQVPVVLSACNPQDADPFLQADAGSHTGYSALTDEQKKFAVRMFDSVFNETLFTVSAVHGMENRGTDIFDHIYADGKSLNSLFEESYQDLPYGKSVEAIKCECIEALLAGKKLEAAVPGFDEPVSLHAEAKDPQFQAAADRVNQAAGSYAAEIRANEAALLTVSQLRTDAKKERMRRDEPVYGEMKEVEPYTAFSYQPPVMSPEETAHLSHLRGNKLPLFHTGAETEERRSLREDMTSHGIGFLDDLCAKAGLSFESPILKDSGIYHRHQIFYIDGKPAEQYLLARYPDAQNDFYYSSNPQAAVEAEIVSALLSGEHHVEAMQAGMVNGQYTTGIVEIRPDVTFLNGTERIFELKPTRQMEKLFANDSGREERQAKIRGDFSAMLAQAAGREMKRRESAHSSYARAASMLDRSAERLTEDYFTIPDTIVLSKLPEDSLSDRYFTGYRHLAEFLLLADHPDIPMADLTDPGLYKDEKQACGRRVADVFTRLSAGDASAKTEAAGLFRNAMEVISRLDLPKEVLYAIGKPELTDPNEILEALRAPENLPVTETLFTMAAGLAGDGAKALLYGQEQFGEELDGVCGKELTDRYERASQVLSGLSDAERKIEVLSQAAAGELAENNLQNKIAAMDARTAEIRLAHLEQVISKGGAAADIPESRLTGGLDETILRNLDDTYGSLSPMEIVQGMQANPISSEAAEMAIAAAKEQVISAERRYFGNVPDDYMKGVLKQAEIRTMDRMSSRTSLAILNLMKQESLSLQELTEADPRDLTDACARAGENFIEFLKENPYHASMKPEEKQASLVHYGEFYKDAADRITSQRLPVPDPKDPTSLCQAYPFMQVLSDLYIDYAQTSNALAMDEPAFVEAFGGAESFRKAERTIEFLGWFGKVAAEAANPDTVLNNRFSARYALDYFLPLAAGKTGDEMEITDEIRNEIKIRYQQAREWTLECPEELLSQAEEYGKGNGPMPGAEEIEKRVAAAKRLELEAAAERQIAEKEAFQSGIEYFDSPDHSLYDHYSKYTGIGTLNRQATRGSMAILFSMCSNDCSLKESLELPSDAKKQAGRDFLAMLDSHPYQPEMPGRYLAETARFYGDFYQTAASRYLEESLPVFDPSDICSLAENYDSLRELAAIGKDYAQTKKYMQLNEGFADSYGGTAAMELSDQRISYVSTLCRYACDSVREGMTDQAAFSSKACFELFGSTIMGKKFNEITLSPEEMMDVSLHYIAFINWSNQVLSDDYPDKALKHAVKDYISGNGPLPELTGFKETLEDTRAFHQVKKAEMEQQETGKQTASRKLEVIDSVSEYTFKPGLISTMQLEKQSLILAGSGRMLDEGGVYAEQRSALVRECSGLFKQMTADLKTDIDYPLYRAAAIDDPSDLFFIDGVPAAQFAASLYGEERLPERGSVLYQGILQAEILSAVMSGSHRVEYARAGLDPAGLYQVGVTEIHADMKRFNEIARAKHMTGSELTERFYEKDPEKESRISHVRSQMAEKLVSASQKLMLKREMERNPFMQAAARFTSDAAVNHQYFGPGSRESRLVLEESSFGQLTAEDAAGLRALTQLTLLSEVPDCRLADLNDPNRFADEKLKAGERVTAAFASWQMAKRITPDTAVPKEVADILSAAMNAMAGLDLKKELLYAAGADPALTDPAAVHEILDSAEHAPEMNGLLRSVLSLRKDAEAVLHEAETDMQLKSSVVNTMGEESYKGFLNADRALAALESEERFAESIRTYASGQYMSEEELTKARCAYCQMMQNRAVLMKGGPAGKLPADEMEFTASLEPQISLQLQKAQVKDHVGGLMAGSLSPSAACAIAAEGKAQALYGPGAYFERAEDLYLHAELSLASGNPMKQPQNLIGLAPVCAAAAGMTPAEMADPASETRKKRAGAEALVMAESYPLNQTPQRTDASAAEYGEVFAAAAKQFDSFVFPDAGPADPGETEMLFDTASAAAEYTGNFSLLSRILEKYPAFTRAFGGPEALKEEQERCDQLSFLSSCMRTALSPLSSPEQRISARLTADRFADRIRGQKAGDIHLSAEETASIREFNRMAAEWAEELPEGQKQEMMNYVNGTGACPDLSGLDEKQNALKQQKEAAARQEAERTAREKAAAIEKSDAFREDMRPARRQVGFSGILSQETAVSGNRMSTAEHMKQKKHGPENGRSLN